MAFLRMNGTGERDLFEAEREPAKPLTILLVGCGKQKASGYRRAEQLYTGALTATRIRYAKASNKLWYILSAKHGLLAPETFLAPYDLTIDDLRTDEKARWTVNVAGQITALLAPDQEPADITVELHAGADYRNALAPILRALGFTVTAPVEGLGMFKQIGFYQTNNKQKEQNGD